MIVDAKILEKGDGAKDKHNKSEAYVEIVNHTNGTQIVTPKMID